MKLFVFVPGILGTSLRQTGGGRHVIWPPGEVNAFQSRTYDQLTAPLAADQVIPKVCIVEVYSTIVSLFADARIPPLGPGPKPDQAYLLFPYDWRLSIQSQAQRLADALEAATADGD